eukprot:7548600-Pyramimonas_sp.AAC.1
MEVRVAVDRAQACESSYYMNEQMISKVQEESLTKPDMMGSDKDMECESYDHTVKFVTDNIAIVAVMSHIAS